MHRKNQPIRVVTVGELRPLQRLAVEEAQASPGIAAVPCGRYALVLEPSERREMRESIALADRILARLGSL